MSELANKLGALSAADITTLLEKGKTYGDSWKKRGGTGAFMMLARKWDRIEKAARDYGYDIFAAIESVDYLIDDIIDLGCYLWLVRSEGLLLDDDEDTVKRRTINEEEGIITAEDIRRTVDELPSGNPYANIDDDDVTDTRDPWKAMAERYQSPGYPEVDGKSLLERFNVSFMQATTDERMKTVAGDLLTWNGLNEDTRPPLLTVMNRHAPFVVTFLDESGQIMLTKSPAT